MKDMSVKQYIPANGFHPVYMEQRGINVIEGSLKMKHPNIPPEQLKDRPRYKIEPKLDRVIEEYERTVVRPRSSLLDSEKLAIDQLKQGVGISSRGPFTLPMQDEYVDRVYKMLEADQEQSGMLLGNTGQSNLPVAGLGGNVNLVAPNINIQGQPNIQFDLSKMPVQNVEIPMSKFQFQVQGSANVPIPAGQLNYNMQGTKDVVIDPKKLRFSVNAAGQQIPVNVTGNPNLIAGNQVQITGRPLVVGVNGQPNFTTNTNVDMTGKNLNVPTTGIPTLATNQLNIHGAALPIQTVGNPRLYGANNLDINGNDMLVNTTGVPNLRRPGQYNIQGMNLNLDTNGIPQLNAKSAVNISGQPLSVDLISNGVYPVTKDKVNISNKTIDVQLTGQDGVVINAINPVNLDGATINGVINAIGAEIKAINPIKLSDATVRANFDSSGAKFEAIGSIDIGGKTVKIGVYNGQDAEWVTEPINANGAHFQLKVDPSTYAISIADLDARNVNYRLNAMIDPTKIQFEPFIVPEEQARLRAIMAPGKKVTFDPVVIGNDVNIGIDQREARFRFNDKIKLTGDYDLSFDPTGARFNPKPIQLTDDYELDVRGKNFSFKPLQINGAQIPIDQSRAQVRFNPLQLQGDIPLYYDTTGAVVRPQPIELNGDIPVAFNTNNAQFRTRSIDMGGRELPVDLRNLNVRAKPYNMNGEEIKMPVPVQVEVQQMVQRLQEPLSIPEAAPPRGQPLGVDPITQPMQERGTDNANTNWQTLNRSNVEAVIDRAHLAVKTLEKLSLANKLEGEDLQILDELYDLITKQKWDAVNKDDMMQADKTLRRAALIAIKGFNTFSDMRVSGALRDDTVDAVQRTSGRALPALTMNNLARQQNQIDSINIQRIIQPPVINPVTVAPLAFNNNAIIQPLPPPVPKPQPLALPPPARPEIDNMTADERYFEDNGIDPTPLNEPTMLDAINTVDFQMKSKAADEKQRQKDREYSKFQREKSKTMRTYRQELEGQRKAQEIQMKQNQEETMSQMRNTRRAALIKNMRESIRQRDASAGPLQLTQYDDEQLAQINQQKQATLNNVLGKLQARGINLQNQLTGNIDTDIQTMTHFLQVSENGDKARQQQQQAAALEQRKKQEYLQSMEEEKQPPRGRQKQKEEFVKPMQPKKSIGPSNTVAQMYQELAKIDLVVREKNKNEDLTVKELKTIKTLVNKLKQSKQGMEALGKLNNAQLLMQIANGRAGYSNVSDISGISGFGVSFGDKSGFGGSIQSRGSSVRRLAPPPRGASAF